MLETKIDVGKTALLIIDMQNDLIKAKQAPYDAITSVLQTKGGIAKTAKVMAAARQASMSVIYTTHVREEDDSAVVPAITDLILHGITPQHEKVLIEGTFGVQIVDELRPVSGERVIQKHRCDAFYKSDLELILRSLGVDTLIIVGVATDGCVADTVGGARERDFNVIVLSDCCATTLPRDDAYFLKKVFPKVGRVRTTDEILPVLSVR